MRENVTRKRLAIGLLMLVILLLAVFVWYVFLPLGHFPSESTPMAGFEHEYSPGNDTLTIRQVGGNYLTGRVTVWITDAETNTTETVVWHDSDNPPTLDWDVSLVITDQDDTGPTRVPAVTFNLNPGDHARIQYNGRPLSNENKTITTTLGEFIVGNNTTYYAISDRSGWFQ